MIVEYNGAPSAYTHTISVKAIEPTKVKYATVTVVYPSAPPHKNTIIKGIMKALNRTVGNPIRIKRYGSFFKNLPTRYAVTAASRVASEPMNTSYTRYGDARFDSIQPMYRAGMASGKKTGKIQSASAGRTCNGPKAMGANA